MPDMLAHYEIAEATRKKSTRGALADVLAAEHDTHRVGAQGPNFFFCAGV